MRSRHVTIAGIDAERTKRMEADYVCDGIDDIVELQHAVNVAAAFEGTGVVHIYGTLHLDNATINLPDGVTLQGEHGWDIMHGEIKRC